MLHCFLNQANCFGALALTQCDAENIGSHLFRQCKQVLVRIRSSRQHKYQWRRSGGIVVTSPQVERWRFDKLVAEMVFNEVLNSCHHLVSSQRSHDTQPLKWRAVMERSWEHGIVRVVAVKDGLPPIQMVRK